MAVSQDELDVAIARLQQYEQRFRIEALAALQRGENLDPRDIRAMFAMADDPPPIREQLIQECVDRIQLFEITARLKS